MGKTNCATCKIPINVPRIYPVTVCNPCIRYLNSLDDKEFAEVAVNCFGKTRKEADKWLSRPTLEDKE
jgi:hypothetical protein